MKDIACITGRIVGNMQQLEKTTNRYCCGIGQHVDLFAKISSNSMRNPLLTLCSSCITGFCQLLFEMAFAIAMHGRSILVFAEVRRDEILVQTVFQADQRHGKYFHHHQQNDVTGCQMLNDFLHEPSEGTARRNITLINS